MLTRVVYLPKLILNPHPMRFIAVYHQTKSICAKGFRLYDAALEYLYWAYEDNDLKPLGIYDALLWVATLYQQEYEPPLTTDLELIEEVARAYIAQNDSTVSAYQ